MIITERTVEQFEDLVKDYESRIMNLEKLKEIDIVLSEDEKQHFRVFYGNSYKNFYVHKIHCSQKVRIFKQHNWIEPDHVKNLSYHYSLKEQWNGEWFNADYVSRLDKHVAIENYNNYLTEKIRVFTVYRNDIYHCLMSKKQLTKYI